MKKKTNKSLNPTERKRISRDKVKLMFDRNDGEIHSCHVTMDLAELKFHPDSAIFLDAYRGYEFKRFSLGSIENPSRTDSLSLEDLVNKENLMFSLKVVDENGKILGICKGLKPSNAGDNDSLLPVSFRPLDSNRIWELEFGSMDDSPNLVFNNLIPEIRQKSKYDNTFFFLVYPVVFGLILRQILINLDNQIDNIIASENDDPSWQKDWIEFALKMNPIDIKSDMDIDSKLEWIDECEKAFAMKYSDRWDRIITDEGSNED